MGLIDVGFLVYGGQYLKVKSDVVEEHSYFLGL